HCGGPVFLHRDYDSGSSVSFRSIELAARRGLLGAYSTRDDVGARVVLAFHLRAREAAKHRELADVRQRIGDRALKDLLGRRGEWRVRREIVVEPLDRGKKTFHFAAPRER